MDDLYLDSIIDRYKNPTNKGWIDDAKIYKTHNPSCGDSFEIAMRWKDGVVVDAKWRGEGCAISTVSTDVFCAWAIGKNKLQIKDYSRQMVRDLTEIDSITPAREKCLYLPLSLS